MKIRIIALTVLVIATIFVIAQSLPISQFPNVSTPLDSDLFVLAQTQAPKTNKNIRYDQLRGAIRSGMATETYVNNATNGLATTNYANQVASNRVVVLAATNTTVVMTSTNGTNFYAVSSSGGGAVLWTNSGGFVMLTTNGPVSIASTGLLGGLVVTQDIRFLGHNSASNSVWVCTNATTGEGEWRTVSAVVSSSLNLTNDPHRLVLQAEPVQGSVYYTGTNGVVSTNGARGGFEFHPSKRSLKMGDASGVQWNDTNTGQGSVNFGSNNIAGGRFTSITGGRNNTTHTNVENAFIGGGINNTVDTNSTNIVIGGGENNRIQLDCANSTIGGGVSHSIRRAAPFSTIGGGASNVGTDPYATIGGGLNNFISDESIGNVIDSTASTISGGEESIARGLRTTIGGGYKHNLISDCNYSVISGGSSNGMGIAGGPGNGTQFSVISGGSQNAIGTSANFSTISGGQLNIISANSRGSSIGGGVSNNIGVNAVYSGIIGNWGTNSDAHTLLISHEKVTVRGRTNGTLVAGSHATLTNRVAGAGSGNTNYTLLATTSRMYLGSSNVNIVAVMRTEAGVVMPWTCYITNLSADTWGFSFSAATNRVRWQSYMYGTSAPVVLTNNTLLRLNGESEGTNTLVTYEYFSPGL